ncbi:MAG: O-antigen ligase family protein [Bacteroidia bacterium]
MRNSQNHVNFKRLLLILPAFIPLLPIHLSSPLLIIWALLSLLYYLLFPEKRIAFSKNLFLPISIFFLFLLSWPFSNDFNNQAKLIERSLAWLFIPLACWMASINKKEEWTKIVSYFSYGLFVLLLISHGYSISFISHQPNRDVATLTYQYRTYFESISHLHPAYASLFSGLSISFFVIRFFNVSNLKFKIGYALLAVLTMLSTLLLASRMALAATLIAILILILLHLPKIKEGLSLLLLFAFAGYFFSINTPFVSERMKEINSEAFQLPVKNTPNTLSIRTGIYTCAFQLLKDHWLLGLTPGDLQNQLNNRYVKLNAPELAKTKYNTHNEYLNYWLCFGLMGLLSILALLIIPFWQAFRTKNFLFICFLLLISIAMLSENIFSRQYGLFFFLIFYCSGSIYIANEKIK